MALGRVLMAALQSCRVLMAVSPLDRVLMARAMSCKACKGGAVS